MWELEKNCLDTGKWQQHKTFSKTCLYLSRTPGDFLREIDLKAQKNKLDCWCTPHSPDQTRDLTQQVTMVTLHTMMMKTGSVAERQESYIGKENVNFWIFYCLMPGLFVVISLNTLK